jgi:hypothetical protein
VTTPEAQSRQTNRPLQTIPQHVDGDKKAPMTPPEDDTVDGTKTAPPAGQKSPTDATKASSGNSDAGKKTDTNKSDANKKTGVDKTETNGPDMKLQQRDTFRFSGREGLSAHRRALAAMPVPGRLRSAQVHGQMAPAIEKFAGPSDESLARN